MRLSTYGMECRWSQSHLEADAHVLLDIPPGWKVFLVACVHFKWLASIFHFKKQLHPGGVQNFARFQSPRCLRLSEAGRIPSAYNKLILVLGSHSYWVRAIPLGSHSYEARTATHVSARTQTSCHPPRLTLILVLGSHSYWVRAIPLGSHSY